MTTPEQFLKAYNKIKQEVETKQQKQEERKQIINKKLALKTWKLFARKATTKKFLLEQVALYSNCSSYIRFETNLKSKDCYTQLVNVFEENGWIIEEYRWTEVGLKMILFLKFPPS